MSVNDPTVGSERALSSQEVIDFRDEIIWPAVNQQFGGDFVGLALPGSDIMCAKTVIDPEDPVFGVFRIEFQAHCILAEVNNGDDVIVNPRERLCLAAIAVLTKRFAQTYELLARAEKALTHYDPDFVLTEERRDGMSAWQRETYWFTTDDDDPGDTKVEMELQLDDGRVFWDSDIEGALQLPSDEQPDGETSDDELDDLGELFDEEQDIGTTMTNVDLIVVKSSLGGLGFNFD